MFLIVGVSISGGEISKVIG